MAKTPSGRKEGTIRGREKRGTRPKVPDEINANRIPLMLFLDCAIVN